MRDLLTDPFLQAVAVLAAAIVLAMAGPVAAQAPPAAPTCDEQLRLVVQYSTNLATQRNAHEIQDASVRAVMPACPPSTPTSQCVTALMRDLEAANAKLAASGPAKPAAEVKK